MKWFYADLKAIGVFSMTLPGIGSCFTADWCDVRMCLSVMTQVIVSFAVVLLLWVFLWLPAWHF